MLIDTVVDDLQDELCNHCKNNITDDIPKPQYGWLCEGSYCDEAEIDFYNVNPIGIRYYRKCKLDNIEKLDTEK